MRWQRWLPDRKPPLPGAVALGFTAGGVAVLLRLCLGPAVGTELPLLTFFPALLAASIWGGIAAGAVCLLLCCGAAILMFPHLDTAAMSWSVLAFVVIGGLVVLVASALAATIQGLRETQRRMETAEAGLRTLVGEMAHRHRNGLTVVIAMLRQSARDAGSARELADVVTARLAAMADAQDEVIRGGSDTAELRKLLDRTLAPFDLARFSFEASPEILLARETAAAVALVAHELATNAVKHGALGAEPGRVTISWTLEKVMVQLRWRESGGPAVSEPTAQGFGTRLLGSVLAGDGGRVVHSFEPEGLVCDIAFPGVARDPIDVRPVLEPARRETTPQDGAIGLAT